MDTTANRQFGQLMYNLIRGRIVEAEIKVPLVTVGTLGSFLVTAALEVRSCAGELWAANLPKHEAPDFDNPPAWLEAIVQWNPRAQLIMRTFLPMVWLSLLDTTDERRAVQVIPHTNEFFKARGYRELDEKELVRLTEQVVVLSSRQHRPGLLGAAGDALLNSTRRPVSNLPPGRGDQGMKRRRAYLQEAWQLCSKVETTQALADRKAFASELGEKLEAELRASRAANTSQIMGLFWEEFNLFFSGSQLAK